jgi:hypothetical protein
MSRRDVSGSFGTAVRSGPYFEKLIGPNRSHVKSKCRDLPKRYILFMQYAMEMAASGHVELEAPSTSEIFPQLSKL